SGVASWNFEPMNLSASGRPQRVMGAMVSANYFSVLGVSASRGRTFVAQEDSGRGAHSVTVLSDATWKGIFGADPEIVGKAVVLNGQKFTVIGVAPAGFKGSIAVVTPAMWVPLMQLGTIRP